MYGQNQGGNDHEAEFNAIQSLLDKVRGSMAKDSGEEQVEEDFLDPETLGQEESASLETEPTSEVSEDVGGLESEPEEEKFDPASVMEFLQKKPGMDRKPLKGMKVGMSESKMPAAPMPAKRK